MSDSTYTINLSTEEISYNVDIEETTLNYDVSIQEAQDGQDGITPQLSATNTALIVSTDDGNTWSELVDYETITDNLDLSNLVPYTGATTNVDLGSNSITANSATLVSSFIGTLLVNENVPYNNSVAFEVNGVGGFNDGVTSTYFNDSANAYAINTTGDVYINGNITANFATFTDDVDVVGQLTAPNQTVTIDSDVINYEFIKQQVPLFFKSKVFPLGAGWTSFASLNGAFLGMTPNYLTLADGDGNGAITAFPNGGLRGTYGNTNTSTVWGLTNYANTTYRVFFEFTTTGGRWSYATCSFAAVMGDHYYSMTHSLSTLVNPAGTANLFGISCVGGALSAWTKRGASSAISSPTLITLSDSYCGRFILECRAGYLYVYHNETLLNPSGLSGAPIANTGPSNLYVNMTTNSGGITEFLIQQAAVIWE